MSIRHYVLLATDGYIELPTTPEICQPEVDKDRVYVFGFVGGLYKVNDDVINPKLNWEDPDNWAEMIQMTSTATIPSPMMWGEVGDKIYVTLINLGMPISGLMDLHTVHLHGAHVATQLDGFPETSFGVPMWMNTEEEPPNVTYFFQPEHPGTLMYHCHIEASEHVQMGMYGALIIYPSICSLMEAGIYRNQGGNWTLNGIVQKQIPICATNRNFAYNDIMTYYDKEYVLLLSDIDTRWHDSVEGFPIDFNPVDFKPDYWLVNGRAFPDTLKPHPLTETNSNNKDLTQINYESYVHVKTGDKFLLRMINMGYQVVPWHIHGWHFTIAGKDAHISPNIKLVSMLKELLHDIDKQICINYSCDNGCHELLAGGFTATIASGETYDLLLTADDKRAIYRNYIVKGQDNIKSLCKQMKELKRIDPASIFDIPTDPVNCPQPDTVNYIQICNCEEGEDKFFPQFYPMHNHDDYKVTNNGVYPGGQLTYIQTDAP